MKKQEDHLCLHLNRLLKRENTDEALGTTATWPTGEMGPVKINICPAGLTSFLFWGETKEREKILAEAPS